MSNTIGDLLRITIFGQSHGGAVGMTMEGLPAGIPIDGAELQAFLNRRAPGGGELTSPRKEPDHPEFLSGLKNGVTCGGAITAVIRNTDCRSADYDPLQFIPRPGHADYPAMVRDGAARDYSGGGRFSGRLTAPLCIAGGIGLQILRQKGIEISAKIESIGKETDENRMKQTVLDAKQRGDSVGGVISCRISGLEPGIGEPMFDGLENRIAQVVFGIPGIKGIEFGSGFSGSEMTGSENNDSYEFDGFGIRTVTNHHGGILGGMSTGMPVEFRVAVKPTPSIRLPQNSVDIRTGSAVRLEIQGRHDPCIVYRAVPCIEAAAAISVLDELLLREGMKTLERT